MGCQRRSKEDLEKGQNVDFGEGPQLTSHVDSHSEGGRKRQRELSQREEEEENKIQNEAVGVARTVAPYLFRRMYSVTWPHDRGLSVCFFFLVCFLGRNGARISAPSPSVLCSCHKCFSPSVSGGVDCVCVALSVRVLITRDVGSRLKMS